MSSLERYNSDIFAYQYDYLKGSKSNNGDIDYYLNNLFKVGGSTLEIGAGTGRITIELVKNGVNVVGIDNAEAMIRLAKLKAKNQNLDIDFYVLDVLEINPSTRYNNIIIPFNTICFFENKDLLHIFKLLFKTLAPNGNLFFDFTRPKNNIYKNISVKDASWSEVLFLKELNIYVSWQMIVKPNLDTSSVDYEYNWKVSSNDFSTNNLDILISSSHMCFSTYPFEYYKKNLETIGFNFNDCVTTTSTRDGEKENHYFCHFQKKNL